jgi:hypothetical protein
MAQCAAAFSGMKQMTAHPRRIWLGRDPELSELAAGLDDLSRGRGSLFLISGEPGIGKTRLADEAARAAAGRGIPVHWGRVWEAGGAPSYWPFIQILRAACRDRELPPVHAAEIAELMPELRARHPELPPATHERFQLFDAVASALRTAAAQAPCVLVFDDVHAADPSSLQLLQFLVRDLRSSPLLVIGTYREAEVRLDPELTRIVAHIAREACVLPLRRLERTEVADYIAQATGVVPSGERIDAVFEQSEGNPLFLREMLQLRASSARQPAGIREVVRARLALLAADTRRVLDCAAVLGRELALAPVASIAELSPPAAMAILEPAIDAGVIEMLEAERWRFTHVLLRDGLYDDLPPDRRRELHRAAAEALQGASLAEVAHHLAHAVPLVEAGRAAEVAVRAAEHALELLAFEDAASLYARACRLRESVGDRSGVCDALCGLGTAQILATDVSLGKATCERSAELARSLGDGARFARATLASTIEFTPGAQDGARLEEALAMLPPGDGSLRARCMAWLAAEHYPALDSRAACELAREAVAMAGRIGDDETTRHVLTAAGLALLIGGEVDERAAINREMIRLSRAANDTKITLRGYLLSMAERMEVGDRAGVAMYLDAYADLVRRYRRAPFQWIVPQGRAALAFLEGRLDEALELQARSQELGKVDPTLGLGMLAMEVGRYCALERPADVDAIEATLRKRIAPVAHEAVGLIGELFVAQLRAREGDRRRTEIQLATVRAHPKFGELGEPAWLALLAEACRVTGDRELAARIYPALVPRATRFRHHGAMDSTFEPPYGRQLGLLARTLGRLDDAIAHFDDAEARSTAIGMQTHVARLRWELADALMARDASGDRERAGQLLVSARALAEQLGQTALLAVIPAPEATVAPPSPAAPGEFQMLREGDVWAIVSGGQTLRLRDSRGLQLLALLVEHRGQELHVLQLLSSEDERVDRGDAGVVLDGQAIAAYRRRLLDLREELEEAESFSDGARAERARSEIEALTDELERAVGLGGRSRRVGGAAERARTTAQNRLRSAIDRIAEGMPALGQHLAQTVHTGVFCGYLPEGRPRMRRR